GSILRGYYPVIVSEDDYLKTRTAQEKRLLNAGGRIAIERSPAFLNAFRGLLVHARDGDGWCVKPKSSAGKPHPILVPTSYENRRGPSYRFPYLVFEKAILSRLVEISPKDLLPPEEPSEDPAIPVREKLQAVQNRLQMMKDDIRKHGMLKTLRELIAEAE